VSPRVYIQIAKKNPLKANGPEHNDTSDVIALDERVSLEGKLTTFLKHQAAVATAHRGVLIERTDGPPIQVIKRFGTWRWCRGDSLVTSSSSRNSLWTNNIGLLTIAFF
jgi:hypothetical protein